MVDRPSSAIVFKSQSPQTDCAARPWRLKSERMTTRSSSRHPVPRLPQVPSYRRELRSRLRRLAGADRLAPSDFRNAQVAIGAMEEMVNRFAPLDILGRLRMKRFAGLSARLPPLGQTGRENGVVDLFTHFCQRSLQARTRFEWQKWVNRATTPFSRLPPFLCRTLQSSVPHAVP